MVGLGWGRGGGAMRQRENLGLWIALAILGIVAALAYRSIDATVGMLTWVEHTHDVLRQADEVNASYARAVAVRREYIFAGDEAQLGEAPALDTRTAQAIAALRSAVADNAAQGARVEAFAELVRQRVEALDDAVRTRRAGGAVAETAETLALTNRIRVVREEFSREEQRLLAEREARTVADLRTTKATSVVGTAASFGLLLFAFGRLRSEVGLRRRSETALRASERFLDSIVENIPDMIFVKGADELRFERINRAGEQLLGLGRKDLLRKNDFDFFPADQAEFFQSRDRQTLAGRAVVDIPEEPIDTKGGPRWLHTKKVPIIDEQGVPRYLLGISEDITETRQVAAALKAAKDAAEAANQGLEAFSYSVAHDLRAPLRAIDGFGQALEEDCAGQIDEVGRSHLRRIRGAAQQMAQLIDGLLSLSRLSQGDLRRDPVDLTRIANEAAARLREAHPDRKVEVVVEDGLSAQGDAPLLAVVFDNLLGNAWKFTTKRDRPRIEVGRRAGDPATIYVRDNGVGFEQAYAHKLFGAFQRLHGSHEFEGTGIGLATVDRIVKRHGGRIWAEGEVGRGATFYFTL